MRNILISAEALSMTWADPSLLSSPFNSKWNPCESRSRPLSLHYISKLSDHSLDSLLIVWRSQDPNLVPGNDESDWRYLGRPTGQWSTDKENKQWMMILYLSKKVGDWAEVIIMTVNDKTFSSELIVFRRKQKDWVHATIRIVDTKTICHVSLIRW